MTPNPLSIMLYSQCDAPIYERRRRSSFDLRSQLDFALAAASP